MNQIPRILTDCITSDTKTIPESSLYIGTGGTVKVTGADGGDVTFLNVEDGTFLPITVVKVWSTGTTASDIILLR